MSKSEIYLILLSAGECQRNLLMRMKLGERVGGEKRVYQKNWHVLEFLVLAGRSEKTQKLQLHQKVILFCSCVTVCRIKILSTHHILTQKVLKNRS